LNGWSKNLAKISASIQQIEGQLDRNQSANLLYSHVERVIEITPQFLAALEAMLAQPDDAEMKARHQALAEQAAQALLKRLYAVNQYLTIDRDRVEALKQIYATTWKALRQSRDVEATLRQVHYPSLSRWLETVYPPHFVPLLRSTPFIGRVVCEEYSPELQMQLYQLTAQRIAEPVLDIGCGSHARLVQHLRQKGVQAFGFDRIVEVQSPYVAQADWLEYRYEPDQWGTILSNMAFSNHAHFAFRQDREMYERYRAVYPFILAALKPGGRFIYAPGTPFLEHELRGAGFSISRRTVVGDIGVTTVTRLG
jgi:hypothetical protein